MLPDVPGGWPMDMGTDKAKMRTVGDFPVSLMSDLWLVKVGVGLSTSKHAT